MISLFVNIDCTLYRAPRRCSSGSSPTFQPGDLIYFDELPEYDHAAGGPSSSTPTRTKLRLVPVSQARGYYWLFQYAT